MQRYLISAYEIYILKSHQNVKVFQSLHTVFITVSCESIIQPVCIINIIIHNIKEEYNFIFKS